MAKSSEKDQPVQAVRPDGSKADRVTTTLDSDVTRPSVTVPGDGPADTTDPTERASSVPVRPGKEALLAGTVNAVVPLPDFPVLEERGEDREDRIEEYQQIRPNGDEVTIRRNIDTGHAEVA